MHIYEQNILDHYRSPRNYGRLEKPTDQAKKVNLSCGDELTVFIDVAHAKIKKIKFIGHGCAISQASISILSEALIGKKITTVLNYNFKSIKKILGIEISERRYNCAMLGLQAIQKALRD